LRERGRKRNEERERERERESRESPVREHRDPEKKKKKRREMANRCKDSTYFQSTTKMSCCTSAPAVIQTCETLVSKCEIPIIDLAHMGKSLLKFFFRWIVQRMFACGFCGETRVPYRYFASNNSTVCILLLGIPRTISKLFTTGDKRCFSACARKIASDRGMRN